MAGNPHVPMRRYIPVSRTRFYCSPCWLRARARPRARGRARTRARTRVRARVYARVYTRAHVARTRAYARAHVARAGLRARARPRAREGALFVHASLYFTPLHMGPVLLISGTHTSPLGTTQIGVYLKRRVG